MSNFSLPAHNKWWNNFWNAGAKRKEGESHDRVRNFKSVADNGDKPGDNIGDCSDPNYGHHEWDYEEFLPFGTHSNIRNC